MPTLAASSAPTAQYPFQVSSVTLSNTLVPTERSDDGEDAKQDEDLSDDAIAALLREAEERLRAQALVCPSTSHPSSLSLVSGQPELATSLPKLNPGTLPKPYILTQRNISRTVPETHVTPSNAALGAHNITDPVVVRRKLKEDEKEATAGSKWFDMPRTNLTPSIKRDLQLLAMRGVLDPKRHYKQNVLKGFPTYSQMGTVIEGNTEFFSSRLTRKERKQTILEEIVSSHETTQRFKRKTAEIDAKKRAGKKRFYKAKVEKHRKY